MARNFPGSGTTDYLTIPASTDWDFNTNINILALIKPATLASDKIIAVWGVSGSNLGFGIDIEDTGGVLGFLKVNTADVRGTSTTAVVVDQWHAVLAFSTNGGNVQFKRYRLDTDSFATQTITDTGTIGTPTNDPGRIGQWLDVDTSTSFDGDIDRVALIQGSILTDAEFIQWAIGGKINRDFKFDSKLLGRSPESDWGGGSHQPTVTGTSIVDGAPTRAPFGFDLGWQGAPAVAAAGVAVLRRRYEGY